MSEWVNNLSSSTTLVPTTPTRKESLSHLYLTMKAFSPPHTHNYGGTELPIHEKIFSRDGRNRRTLYHTEDKETGEYRGKYTVVIMVLLILVTGELG